MKIEEDGIMKLVMMVYKWIRLQIIIYDINLIPSLKINQALWKLRLSRNIQNDF